MQTHSCCDNTDKNSSQTKSQQGGVGPHKVPRLAEQLLASSVTQWERKSQFSLKLWLLVG